MNIHNHNFLLDDSRIERNEKRTSWVVLLTALMMVVEIAAGLMTQSMALLADGWHMASHAGALGIALIAYRLAKSARLSDRFTFGAGKFIPLGGYTSAIILGIVALLMIWESIERLIAPTSIRFNEAIFVAVIGLAVNIASVFILGHDSESHDHEHEHDHHHAHHDHPHHDHNFRAAYLHVIADAMTSVFAIVALLFGKLLGLVWLDAVMGIVGALVILKWAYNLCRDTAWELLDGHPRTIDLAAIRSKIEDDNTIVSDLHVWRIAPRAHACEIVLHARQLRGVEFYRRILHEDFHIQHVIIEERAA